MIRRFALPFATCLVLVSFAILPSNADIRLPAVISDGMVLQQQTDCPIWGWADPGEVVVLGASWFHDEARATANEQGDWKTTLHTPAAGGPYTITIASESKHDGGSSDGTNANSDPITLSDVLIGEVWFCAGQSNMEWPLRWTDGAAEQIAAANYPQIRLFDVEHQIAVTPQADCRGAWRGCAPDSVSGFSAVGYFFGRELHKELGVPIGLIGSNWGGTLAEAWTSAPALRQHGDFDNTLDVLVREAREPGTIEQRGQQTLNAWWEDVRKADRGNRENWQQPDFDTADWPTMTLPQVWERSELGNVDGVVWFRKDVDVPEEWVGRDLTLELGPIDDYDITWFNGAQVGELTEPGQWITPRKYTVPADVVRKGRNVIAVRVIDTGGNGGLVGKPEQLVLRPADGATDAEPISLVGAWQYRLSTPIDQMPPLPYVTRLHQNLPTALYNGMIAPLVPYALRGAIWYQGESNRMRARQYRTLFPAMIADWRQNWGLGDFPFYYVQIAPFNYGGDVGEAAELREAQMMTLKTPNTGMAVTMDIGNPADIHPRNKVTVGRRLAAWALAKTYGREGIIYSGPQYREMRVEGDAVRLLFDHTAGGLIAGKREADGSITPAVSVAGFQIAGADRMFVPAMAVIDGDTVVVRSPSVTKPVAVRYAWGAAAEATLFNKADLPASSFRTDEW